MTNLETLYNFLYSNSNNIGVNFLDFILNNDLPFPKIVNINVHDLPIFKWDSPSSSGTIEVKLFHNNINSNKISYIQFRCDNTITNFGYNSIEEIDIREVYNLFEIRGKFI